MSTRFSRLREAAKKKLLRIQLNMERRPRLPRVLPVSIRDNPRNFRLIYTWAAIGTLARIVFMPIATHADLIAIGWMSQFTAFYGVLDPYGYIDAVFGPGRAGIVVYPPVFLYFEAIIVSAISLVLPGIREYLGRFDVYDVGIYPYDPLTPFLLFLLKIPYLVFDLATAILLLHLADADEKRIFLFKFWMINPIVIFGSYIFGQFDIIPTFLVVLALLYLKRPKKNRSMLTLGVASSFKIFPLLFVLPVALIAADSLKKRSLLVGLALLPMVLSYLPFLRTDAFVKNVIFSEQTSRGLAANVSLGYGGLLYLFIAGFVLITLRAVEMKRDSFSASWRSMLSILALLYAISVFNPQWFLWITPLMGLAIAHEKPVLRLYVLQLLCFVVYTFGWREPVAGWLFAPVSPRIFLGLPSPLSVMSAVFSDAERIIQIFRSIFSGISLWIIYRVLRAPRADVALTEQEGIP